MSEVNDNNIDTCPQCGLERQCLPCEAKDRQITKYRNERDAYSLCVRDTKNNAKKRIAELESLTNYVNGQNKALSEQVLKECLDRDKRITELEARVLVFEMQEKEFNEEYKGLEDKNTELLGKHIIKFHTERVNLEAAIKRLRELLRKANGLLKWHEPNHHLTEEITEELKQDG